MKEENTLKKMKDVKMTPQEKADVWDGVLRRVTDYPPGEYPFEEKPSTWDGTLRRRTDFPEGAYPGDSIIEEGQ
jgi:hypothetical protein